MDDITDMKKNLDFTLRLVTHQIKSMITVLYKTSSQMQFWGTFLSHFCQEIPIIEITNMMGAA